MGQCINYKTYISDSRFSSVRKICDEIGKELNIKMPDIEVATTLVGYQEYLCKDSNWFPDFSDKLEADKFKRYVLHRAFRTDIAPRQTYITAKKLSEIYHNMHDAIRPEYFENRMRFFTSFICDYINKFKDDFKATATKAIVTAEDGNSKGFSALMNKAVKYFNEIINSHINSYRETIEKKKADGTFSEDEDGWRTNKINYLQKQLDYIEKNKERIAVLVANRVSEAEGLKLIYDGFEIKLPVNDEEVISQNENVEEQDDSNDFDETSNGERYVDFRSLNIHETIGDAAKHFLSDIFLYDYAGEQVFDDVGIAVRVDPKEAAVILQRVLHSSTPSTMMSDLKKAVDDYPMLKGIISKLNAKPEYKSTIFNSFKRAKTKFLYVKNFNGRTDVFLANKKTPVNATVRDIMNNMKSQISLDSEYSFTNEDGTLKSAEERTKIYQLFKTCAFEIRGLVEGVVNLTGPRVEGAISRKGTVIAYDKIRNYIREFIDKFNITDKDLVNFANATKDDIKFITGDNPEAILKEAVEKFPGLFDKLIRFARGCGINISRKEFNKIFAKPIDRNTWDNNFADFMSYGYKGANRISVLVKTVEKIIDIYTWIYEHAKDNKDDAERVEKLLYESANYLYKFYKLFGNLQKSKETEERVNSGGKMLTTRYNFNLIHQVVDILADKRSLSPEEYKKSLYENFGRFEGICLGKDEYLNYGGFLNDLIEEKIDNVRNGFVDRPLVQLYDVDNYFDTKYEDMTKRQYIMCQLRMYFNAGAYEVPIQSDYSTAYNFIGMGKRAYIAPTTWEELPKLDYTKATEKEIAEYEKRIEKKEKEKSYDKFYTDLTTEVLIEIERITAIQERLKKSKKKKLSTYEKNGLKFQIFPVLSVNGFLEKYNSIDDPVQKYQYVKDVAKEQMTEIVNESVERFKTLGISVSYPYFEDTIDISENDYRLYREYCMDSFYARIQMCKLFTGGLAQFKNIRDYEKRNMMLHAPRTSMYTEATWDGEKVGRETQNVVYLSDDISKSFFLNKISELLDQLLKEGYISEEQYKSYIDVYKNITVTDGQGFRTFDSNREVMIMSGQWTKKHENAYQRIKGGLVSSSDFRMFSFNNKPIYSGYEIIPAVEGEYQKDVRNTVLHKYSEQVLLPYSVLNSEEIHSILQSNPILIALSLAQKELEEKYEKRIDMFIFKSGVKVGADNVISAFDRDENGKLEHDSIKSMSNFIVQSVINEPSSIHKLEYKYYGITSSTPIHISDDRIAWSTQAEKAAFANIEKGDKVMLRGEEVDAEQARKIFSAIKTTDMTEAFALLQKTFHDKNELERILREEVASKSYASSDLAYSLAQNGINFIIPLFASTASRQMQSLLLSMINKRLNKAKVNGANIMQATSLGVDIDYDISDNTDISDENNIGIVFEGKGKDMHIKYIEAAMPLFDKRLRRFADPHTGGISAKQLRHLIKWGKIPASILDFIAYRTPSDAEHSVLPCRIKYFTPAIMGATIKLPREVMCMTGHDYDGDKLRCHFKNFNLVNDGEPIFGNRDYWIEVDEYDYSKQPKENSKQARDNARIELMWAELTSPKGSRRLVIPGGAGVSAKYAMVQQIMRSSETHIVAFAYVLKKFGLSIKLLGHELYNELMKLDSDKLNEMVDALSKDESALSVTHSYDAFEYMIGSAPMIGIYAANNSLSQLLQRANLSVNPIHIDENNKDVHLNIFGCTIDKLFDIRNKDGMLNTLTYARLLNAAVDNGKNPILGLLNQNSTFASTTFLLSAAGISEEKIHLFLNQPILRYLINRDGDIAQVNSDIDEIANKYNDVKIPSTEESFNTVKEMTMDEWEDNIEEVRVFEEIIEELSVNNSYDEKEDNDEGDKHIYFDTDFIHKQLCIWGFFNKIRFVAAELNRLVLLLRPDSSKGIIGNSIAELYKTERKYKKELEKLKSEGTQHYISGAEELLKLIDVHEGYDTDFLTKEFFDKNKLPEITVANSLIVDNCMYFFRKYFPQARDDWKSMAENIIKIYEDSFGTVTKENIESIFNDMILWKLLSNKNFVQGDTTEEQKRILTEVPQDLRKLLIRIERSVEKGKQSDVDAFCLSNNAFLKCLELNKPKGSNLTRIQFGLDSFATQGSDYEIRAGWYNMMLSRDKSIKQLAFDLFKYNMYTNGFTYGRYEFFQYAPFQLLVEMPGYRNALNDILESGWEQGTADYENFIHQYLLNHWFEEGLIDTISLRRLGATCVKDPETDKYIYRFVVPDNEKSTAKYVIGKKYVFINSGGDYSGRKIMYRVDSEHQNGQTIGKLTPVRKMSAINVHGQKIFQYNPSVDYKVIKPIVFDKGMTAPYKSQVDLANEKQDVHDKLIKLGIDPEQFDSDADAKAALEKAEGMTYDEILIRDKAKLDNLPTNRASSAKKTLANKIEFGNGKTKILFDIVDEPGVETAESSAENVQKNVPKNIAEKINNENNDDSNATDLTGLTKEQLMEELNKHKGLKLFSIVRLNEEGKAVVEQFEPSPNVVIQARKQKAFVSLNKKLRQILKSKGIKVGALTNSEERMRLNGVAVFDTASVAAEGMLELIRLAHGERGEEALPEEFAHLSVEMLGYDHPLVNRLLKILFENEDARKEVYEGLYDQYKEAYGDDEDKLVLEAAGKYIAKHLFREERIQTNILLRLVTRISEAIKKMFSFFNENEIEDAILEANASASEIAKGILSGRLVDSMALENIGSSEKFYSMSKGLSNGEDVLSKLLTIESKRLSILSKRMASHIQAGKTPTAMKVTKERINELKKSIEKHKADEAVITYLKNSMSFLAATEKSLDETVGSGKPANSVCRKLNTVRDTITSIAVAIEYINDAVANGELNNTSLSGLLRSTSGVLAQFESKYKIIAREYFEDMLSSVYGENGVKVTLGKDKGKVISIREMARRADGDISLASSLFNSLADCNDYVLKAFDSIVRSAKMRARKRFEKIRPRLEVAIADLVRNTGSRDQSFMFETVVDENGHSHKTGKYISQEKALSLNPNQRAFYYEIMSIKGELDKYIPNALIEDKNQIVMLRKDALEKVETAEGLSKKTDVAWDNIKNTLMETSSDFDPEEESVAVDFQGNKVDRFMTRFVVKGKNESFDDMTDDVAMSMMVYANMAFEYNELGGVVNILENAKYMAAERDVIQKKGDRKQVEHIKTKNNDLTIPFTKKAAGLHAQEALAAYMSMQVYKHTAADEGTIGNTKLSVRKVTNFLNSLASWSQMALNPLQRISNINTGMSMIVIESAGKGNLNLKDTLWAASQYMKNTPDRLAQTGQTDVDNKLSLWNEHFDIMQDNGRTRNKYSKGRLSRIFNTNLLYSGLAAGEDFLASTTALAVARNIEVRDSNGKKCNLWDAYEVKYLDNEHKTGAFLALKNGYTKADGSPITEEDEMKYTKKVISLNFDMQGIYNLDDKCAAQQYALGSLVMMYRKWIAPTIKRLYGKTQYNELREEYEEGYYRTFGRALFKCMKEAGDEVTEKQGAMALLNIFSDITAFCSSVKINWNNMTQYEQSNVMRALADLGIVLALWLSTAIILHLPPEDEDTDTPMSWLETFTIAQLLRLRTEKTAMAPTPMLIGEATKILKSPAASIGPLMNLLGLFKLMIPSNYTKMIKSGRYKGHSKAYRYFRELPVISMFKRIDNFNDPTPLIKYYESDSPF